MNSNNLHNTIELGQCSAHKSILRANDESVDAKMPS